MTQNRSRNQYTRGCIRSSEAVRIDFCERVDRDAIVTTEALRGEVVGNLVGLVLIHFQLIGVLPIITYFNSAYVYAHAHAHYL